MNAELHVVFGTGPAGSALAERLLAAGKRVRAVNRSGKAALPAGAEVVAGDLLDSGQVRQLCAGAAAVYHCANVHYAEQTRVMPAFQAAVIDGAARAGAKLIVLDTLYVYGRTGGLPMNEAMPFAAHTRKGMMRAKLAETYLQAHAAGTVRVALGRAADFFGPGVRNSSLGDRVFPQALAGARLQLLGDIDLPHSYGYIGDVARGLATLGEREEALGAGWLLPVAPPVTQRAMAGLIAKQLGRPLRTMATPKLAIRAFGLFDSFMREFVEMFYQYTESQIVDSRLFEHTFGWAATPLAEALAATIDWYRGNEPAAAAAPGSRLGAA
ncbi:MAG TPA: NAD-dependent epimerase/dehydratase family protein [Herpetosiphonaceae bacterium]